MEDQGIIVLFFKRSEQAIEETDKKYGGYCYSIAYNILSNREDSEESVSDTYLAAWNTIPPRRPNFLNAFLAKMTRHISIDRWRKLSAKKRGGGEIILALDELEECVDTHNVETELAKKELTRVLNAFLSYHAEQNPHTSQRKQNCPEHRSGQGPTADPGTAPRAEPPRFLWQAGCCWISQSAPRCSRG